MVRKVEMIVSYNPYGFCVKNQRKALITSANVRNKINFHAGKKLATLWGSFFCIIQTNYIPSKHSVKNIFTVKYTWQALNKNQSKKIGFHWCMLQINHQAEALLGMS